MVQYTLMMNQTTTVKSSSKDILAKCMAVEDITVEHRANVPTAYFDTKNRVLCLPIWQDMTNEVYDMLVGHEVSHALHTPAEGWQDFVGEGKGASIRHMFLNIVEDARIERLIKDKFPGIRRDFASAYKTLHTQDLFELKDRTIAVTDELIDRLNLHFKVGLFGLEQIPFADDEKQYVTRMANTVTFEDVVALAKELYEKHIDELPEEDEESQSASGQGESGEGQGESGSEDWQDAMNEDGESQSQSGDGDSETSESTDGAGDDAESQEGEDSGQSQDDDTDDGESADSEAGDSQDSDGDSGEMEYDDYANDVNAAGSSQRAFEKGVENFNDSTGASYTYHTLPKINLDEIIVDFTEIESMWQRIDPDTISERNRDSADEWATELRTFLNESKGTINQMVQQFQMKQAADASHRTQINKTGVLDTLTMVNYRWSEDIFRKNETQPDGKNHGMVMFVDWSGSMSSILKDTVKQLIILVEFCKKVGIPYEVYAFSSNRYFPTLEGMDRYSDEYRDAVRVIDETGNQYTKENEDTDADLHSFQLYNFLSSRMTKRQYTVGLSNFWLTTNSISRYRGYPAPRCLSLGCTPLNEAIVSALEIVPAFQQANGIQIVNTVFLTDGDGHGMGMQTYRGYNRTDADRDILRDKKTRKEYDIPRDSRHGETDALLTLLKARTGCNTVGIRLHDAKNIRNLRYNHWGSDDDGFAAASKQFIKMNYTTADTAYDGYFIVKGDLKVEFDALDSLQDGASYTQLKNAFMKGNTNRKTSRVIATQMVNIFAV
jgi:hypothetical protein